jgi:hypothetical protein
MSGKKGPTKPNRTGTATANDKVMTKSEIAKEIIIHYAPFGFCLEPCRGTGSFYDSLPSPKDWCEIDQGRDFFDWQMKVNWIITNPPYSIYPKFLEHCFEVANNVVVLVPLAKAVQSAKIYRIVKKYGGLREIWVMGSGTKVGFKFGFLTGCLWYQRGYDGPTFWKD